MSQDSKQLVVGRLGAVYGIRGWLKIHSFTDEPESIFDYKPWLVEQRGKPVEIKVEKFKTHGKGWIVKLEGIDVREEAQLLTGAEISVSKEQLPELEDDFYWHDLMGCTVVNLQGYDLGQVSDLMETGSNDVLMVKANRKDAFGKKERLIPFIEDQVIHEIDLATQTIKVDWDPSF